MPKQVDRDWTRFNKIWVSVGERGLVRKCVNGLEGRSRSTVAFMLIVARKLDMAVETVHVVWTHRRKRSSSRRAVARK